MARDKAVAQWIASHPESSRRLRLTEKAFSLEDADRYWDPPPPGVSSQSPAYKFFDSRPLFMKRDFSHAPAKLAAQPLC
jgi:hypothetical protein